MPCVTVPARPNGVADSEDAVADLHLVAVSKLQIGQREFAVDGDDGEIGLGIGLDLRGREFPAVTQLDHHLVSTGDDMIVRDHDALAADQEA